jgi:tripartite-type tricarboxylate transporter receptor subunit TctC
MARELAKGAEKYLGQPVVVENRTGGSLANQLREMLSRPSDGYTVGTVTASLVGTLATIHKDRFKPSDFRFLARVQIDPFVVATRSDSRFKELKDLIAYARANPGKVKVGGFGSTGSAHNLAMMDLSRKGGIDISWVAFDGGSEAVAAALGGHVDVVHTNPGITIQHVKAGKMRVLGVASPKRVEGLPEAPTYREQGIDMEAYQWRGIFAKAGIPNAVAEKLAEAFQKAMEGSDFVQYTKRSNLMMGYQAPKEFEAAFLKEFEDTSAKLKALGVAK